MLLVFPAIGKPHYYIVCESTFRIGLPCVHFKIPQYSTVAGCKCLESSFCGLGWHVLAHHATSFAPDYPFINCDVLAWLEETVSLRTKRIVQVANVAQAVTKILCSMVNDFQETQQGLEPSARWYHLARVVAIVKRGCIPEIFHLWELVSCHVEE